MLQRIIPAFARLLHTTRCFQAVDKSQLSKLRKKTGFPFIACKKALEKFNNDFAKAEAWMKEEAQKEGWAKASKLQNRPMSQGLIGLVKENNMAAMVEINCETDFVSRNVKFQDLVAQAANVCLVQGQKSDNSKLLWNEQIHASLTAEIKTAPINLEFLVAHRYKGYSILKKPSLTMITWGKEDVNELPLEDGKTLADLVALNVGNIGENLALRRGVFMSGQQGTSVGHYIHSSGDHPKDKHCLMGKFGALVAFHRNQVSEQVFSAQELVDIGRQLCQHIVGMNPKTLGAEEDEEPSEDKDSEDKMLFQEFLLDPSLTVREFLDGKGVGIVDYVRLECGEELQEGKEEKEENVDSKEE